MTDKTDKAVEAKQEAAYKKYEAEQADHEKKHPGEIDEPAYAKYEKAYDKAGGKAMSTDRTDAQKKYDAALADAAKLSAAAVEAHAKADQKAKAPDQAAAEEADKKADDARAKAAALHPDTVAPVMFVPPENRFMKRGNHPVNPVYAPGIPTHDEAQTVRLSHMSSDSPSPVFVMVHPDMVGDYLRAGWSHV